MNSILKQELIHLKDSANYWLGISWIAVIVLALLAVVVAITRKTDKSDQKNNLEKSYTSSSKGKGF